MTKKITLDSCIFPLSDNFKNAAKNYEIYIVTVTQRESKECDFAVQLEPLNKISELATWDESKWDSARWADNETNAVHKDILKIISSGSFPLNYSNLNKGQTNQLRDALILEAHIHSENDFFITKDATAFINFNKREVLQSKFGIKILTMDEFLGFASGA